MVERELPLFPLQTVLFPGMRLPLHIFEDRYKLMIGTCMVTDQTFGVALIRSGLEVGGPAEVCAVGTTARIIQIDRLQDGRMNLVTVGVDRFRIIERYDDQPYARGRVELLPDLGTPVPDGLAARVASLYRRFLLGQGVSEERLEALELPDEPLALSYLVAATLRAGARERQRLLETESAAERLRLELGLLEWQSGGPAQANPGPFSVN